MLGNKQLWLHRTSQHAWRQFCYDQENIQSHKEIAKLLRPVRFRPKDDEDSSKRIMNNRIGPQSSLELSTSFTSVHHDSS